MAAMLYFRPDLFLFRYSITGGVRCLLERYRKSTIFPPPLGLRQYYAETPNSRPIKKIWRAEFQFGSLFSLVPQNTLGEGMNTRLSPVMG